MVQRVHYVRLRHAPRNASLGPFGATALGESGLALVLGNWWALGNSLKEQNVDLGA
jgi:hypothetical protein